MRNGLHKVIKPRLLLATLTFTALSGLAPAKAQQVRTLENGTDVRLDPDESSAVLTTLQAGTATGWVSDVGGWYAVSISGLPGEEDLVVCTPQTGASWRCPETFSVISEDCEQVGAMNMSLTAAKR